MPKRTRSKLFSLLLILTLLAPALHAQPVSDYVDLARRTPAFETYHAPLFWPSAEAGRTAVLVPFRLPNPMLVFTRQGEGFATDATVRLETRRADAPAASAPYRTRHTAPTYEATQEASRALEGVAQVVLPPGPAGYRLSLAEQAAADERMAPPKPLEVPLLKAPGVGPAFFAEAIRRGDSTRIDLVNLGGDVRYGQPATALVWVLLEERPGGAALRFTLLRETEDGETVVRQGEVPASAWLAAPPAEALTTADATLAWPTAADTAAFLVPVDLQAERLRDGSYVLRYEVDGAGEGETRFATVWPDIPLALRSVRLAIDALTFVAPDDTVRALRRSEGREAALRAYWQRRDPTPETAYNELMAEYYRRIDHAAWTFRRGGTGAPNGLGSDRAAVYVRQGPPAETQRLFPDDGGVLERWRYPGGRTFVFRAPSSIGPFRLVSGSS